MEYKFIGKGCFDRIPLKLDQGHDRNVEIRTSGIWRKNMAGIQKRPTTNKSIKHAKNQNEDPFTNCQKPWQERFDWHCASCDGGTF